MSAAWEAGLRPYQQEAAAWLADLEGTSPMGAYGRLLADGLGLGKSVQALAAARYRIERGLTESPTAIITTASARRDWMREAARFWPELEVHLPGGAGQTIADREADQRWREALAKGSPHTAFIINYENMEMLRDCARDANVLFGSVIVDEAHNLKRASSKYAKDARALCARGDRRILLTGTPVDNRPHELHNLLTLACPGKFDSYGTFVHKYFVVHMSNWGHDVGELMYPDKLKAAYAHIYKRRTATEVFKDMPARIRLMHLVDAPHAVRISPAKILVMKKKDKLDEMLREVVRYKLKAAAEFVYGLREPVVCYSYRRIDAEALAEMLTAKGLRVVLSHGDIPVKKRDTLIEEWKVGKHDVIVSTMDALRESATLVRAKNMVFVDLDWRFVKVLQCEGRIDPARQPDGQREAVRYHYFLTRNGPDEVVAEALLVKIREAQKLIADPSAAAFGEFLGDLQEEESALAKMDDASLLSAFVQRATSRVERAIDLGL